MEGQGRFVAAVLLISCGLLALVSAMILLSRGGASSASSHLHSGESLVAELSIGAGDTREVKIASGVPLTVGWRVISPENPNTACRDKCISMRGAPIPNGVISASSPFGASFPVAPTGPDVVAQFTNKESFPIDIVVYSEPYTP